MKSEIRRSAAACRALLHARADREAVQAAAQVHLAQWLAGQGGAALSGYLPIRSEIDPVPVMAAHPGPVGVPVIDGPGLALRFRQWQAGALLVPGPFGAMVPEGGADLVPRVVIVPLLAWDRAGFRLGYGGGFYDRTLAALRARGPVTAVGFGFAGQELAAVPRGVWDERLDLVVTEAGVLPFD